MKARRVIQRIRFDRRSPVMAGMPDGRSPRRTWVAADETLPAPIWPAVDGAADTTGILHIAWITGGTADERQELGQDGMAGSPTPDPMATVVFADEELTVEWRPGLAVVRSPVDRNQSLLAALIDFAFFEGALRQLEVALVGCEAQADADVGRGYGIRWRDRRHWRRFRETTEACARLRAAFVQIRPGLEQGAPGLPARGRRLASRLRRRIQAPTRLEGFSERLEFCEDLYEGANDRVADFRWYLGGHVLEIGIIVLLLAEVVLMALELHLRLGGRMAN
jgi:hypothetical protein